MQIDADGDESDELAAGVRRAARASDRAERLGVGPEPERPGETPHALEVFDGGGDDVDPGVRVVDPVDGHLGDAEPVALGEDEQLGVEEPVVVLDRRAGARGPRRRAAP